MVMKNVVLVAIIVLFAALGTVHADSNEGKCTKLLNTICNDCHNTDRVCNSLGGTQKKWKALVEWMISNGAELEDDEKELIINCLVEPYDEAKKACNK